MASYDGRRDRGNVGGIVCTDRPGAVIPAGAPQDVVTRGGTALTLLGPELKPGDAAPDFALTRNDMTKARLVDFAGQTVLLSCVPSLDTKVCDIETRRFNEEAANLKGVTVLTVSMDLPFAQARWCGAHDIKNVITLSDYKTHDFGKAYGVLIQEMGLLARTIFVIGSDGKIKYVQRSRRHRPRTRLRRRPGGSPRRGRKVKRPLHPAIKWRV